MDITKFLNSKDIREHLQAMDYSFDAVTAAYLVWQCHNATLEEKFTAWEEIAKAMPDCPIPRRPGMADDVPSVHQFLRDYIAFQKQRLVEFSQPGRWVYTAQFFHEKSAQWSDLGHFFTIYQDCLDACREAIQENSHWLGKIAKLKLSRYPLDDPKHRPWELELNRELRPLSIKANTYEEIEEVFPSFWLNIPTPFRRGDIVWDPSGQLGFPHDGKSVPFVLSECVNWNKKAMLENGFSPEAAQQQEENLFN